MKKTITKILITMTIAFAVCLLVDRVCFAGTIYGETIFKGDVYAEGWSEVTNVTAATTTGGTYTSGSFDLEYKLSGTNFLGRIPTSLVAAVSFTGSASENAINVGWSRYDGLFNVVLLKSSDGGATFPEWIALAPNATNLVDDGSLTFITSDFLGDNPLIPDPVVPWASSTDTNIVFKNQFNDLYESNKFHGQAFFDELLATNVFKTERITHLGDHTIAFQSDSLVLTGSTATLIKRIHTGGKTNVLSIGTGINTESGPNILFFGTELPNPFTALGDLSLITGTNEEASIQFNAYSDATTVVQPMQIDSDGVRPGTDNTFDLGSSSLKWKDLYVSGSSIFMGDNGLFMSESNLGDFAVSSTNIYLGANRIYTDNFNLYFENAAGNSEQITDLPIYPTPLVWYKFDTGSPLLNSGTLGASYNGVDPGGANSPTPNPGTGGESDSMFFAGGDYLTVGSDTALLDGNTGFTIGVWARDEAGVGVYRAASAILITHGPNISPPSQAGQTALGYAFSANEFKAWARTDSTITGHHDIRLNPINEANGEFYGIWKFYLIRGRASDLRVQLWVSDAAGTLSLRENIVHSQTFTTFRVNEVWRVAWNDTFSPGGTATFIGKVDDVVMWDKYLTDAELNGFYNDTQGGHVNP